MSTPSNHAAQGSSIKDVIQSEVTPNKEKPLVNGNSTIVASQCIDSSNFKNPSDFDLTNLYKYGLKFYKDKSGKAVHISYEDKCHLVALSHQVNNGPFNPETAETLGVFDVVGKDRRLAWQSLGDITTDAAMTKFIEQLHRLTTTFQPYIEAVWADHLEKKRIADEDQKKKELDEAENIKQAEIKKLEEEEQKKQEGTKRHIQEALNEQTFLQFKSYAEQQYPGNPEQQGVLIKQLQEQHYQQYMQQVYQQQIMLEQQNTVNPENSEIIEAKEAKEGTSVEIVARDSNCEYEGPTEEEEDSESGIVPASMWTRRDMKEFKDSIRQEGGDSVIKVGHGETVTVRVPTHDDGTCLFWEFATDSYDIGFGVLFEWTNDPSNVVSIHITESDDDDEDGLEDDDDEQATLDDIERAAGLKPESDKPPQSVIIPVYRRDCHEEVYAGSHAYPGKGVYLLKFDNNYSLWRSKMLYYRVYYTR